MPTHPVVPENVLKRRKTLEQIQAERKEKIDAQRSKRKVKKGVMFKKASAFVKEYRTMERNVIRMKRVAKKPIRDSEPESELLLVLRTKGTSAVDPKTRKILHFMRLQQANEAVFIRATPSSLNTLRLVAPFVAYGAPSLKTVRDLVVKRGFAIATDRRRVPLTDNRLVEDALGKLGMVCVEDLVHEIASVGPNFREATRFLAPFQLHLPKGSKAPRSRPPPAGAAGAGAEGEVASGEIHVGEGDWINQLVASMN